LTVQAQVGISDFTVSFAARAGGGSAPYTFLWDFGDGTADTVQNPTHTYVAAGTYPVVVKVTDAKGVGATATVSVTVPQTTFPITLSITVSPLSVTAGSPVSFTATATGGTLPYASFLWDFGDGTTSKNPNTTHVYATSGAYTAIGTATDSKGAKGTASAVIVVAPSASGPLRLGFWIDEAAMWSGVGLNWTPQQFVNNVFLSPPYPSAWLYATSIRPGGPSAPTKAGEAAWLSQVASLIESQKLDVKVILLFFVNLSGGYLVDTGDQTQDLTDFMQAIKGHPSILGAEYEREYYGNTVAEVTKFRNIVTAAGYAHILDPSQRNNFPTDPILDYGGFPDLHGTPIPSNLSARSIGIGYGATGETCPAVWTQANVQAIIDRSPGNPFVFIYAVMGCTTAGQPKFHFWKWPTFLSWITSDPNYPKRFVLAK
jgi:PKD repeat protein